jgi:hypothetical protein
MNDFFKILLKLVEGKFTNTNKELKNYLIVHLSTILLETNAAVRIYLN